MYTTNGIITEVVECHECSNHRRSEMKYSSINKRLFVSVGWKGELVFRHWYWKTNFFYCYPNLQGSFSFDAGFKRYCRLLCVSSLSPLFSCCFVSASISAAILDILFFSHETTGINIKYIFPTTAWFLYLGEKAYFRWIKRLRGKGKKNGLMENCFAEYWGWRHGKNDRIEKSLCIATLRDRKRFVCLFVFFQNCGKD